MDPGLLDLPVEIWEKILQFLSPEFERATATGFPVDYASLQQTSQGSTCAVRYLSVPPNKTLIYDWDDATATVEKLRLLLASAVALRVPILDMRAGERFNLRALSEQLPDSTRHNSLIKTLFIGERSDVRRTDIIPMVREILTALRGTNITTLIVPNFYEDKMAHLFKFVVQNITWFPSLRTIRPLDADSAIQVYLPSWTYSNEPKYAIPLKEHLPRDSPLFMDIVLSYYPFNPMYADNIRQTPTWVKWRVSNELLFVHSWTDISFFALAEQFTGRVFGLRKIRFVITDMACEPGEWCETTESGMAYIKQVLDTLKRTFLSDAGPDLTIRLSDLTFRDDNIFLLPEISNSLKEHAKQLFPLARVIVDNDMFS